VEESGNYLIKGTTHETASRIWGDKKITLLAEIVGVLSWIPGASPKHRQVLWLEPVWVGFRHFEKKRSNAKLRP
jgi:hypothetical protein